MQGKNVFLSISIAFLFVINACSSAESGDHLSSIQSAVNQTSQLENGKFSYTNTTGNQDEEQTQSTEGRFITHDESVDWYTEMVVGEGESNQTITEVIQKDQTQYRRFGRVNEEHQFIGNNNEVLTEEPEWQLVQENATGYPEALKSVMNLELNEENMENIEKKEGDSSTIYEMTYNDAYLSSLEEENIAAIEEQLKKAKQGDADPNMIQSLEKSLAYNENITYEDIHLTLTVDEEGVLIGEERLSSYEQTVNDATESIQMTERVEITEYNVADMEIEL